MSKIYDALQNLEAQRKAMDSGEATGPAINPLDLQEHPLQQQPVASTRAASQTLLEQAAAVTRFGAELHRRMGEAGLDGLQGLFALAEQLQRARATVSTPELDTAQADLDRVAARVREMKDGLSQLKAVKTDLAGFAGSAKQ
jgi:hypothetical protein